MPGLALYEVRDLILLLCCSYSYAGLDVKLHYKPSREALPPSGPHSHFIKFARAKKLKSSLVRDVKARLRKALGRKKGFKVHQKVMVRHSKEHEIQSAKSVKLKSDEATFKALENRAFVGMKKGTILQSKDAVLQRREELIGALVEALGVKDTPELRSQLHVSLQDSHWDVEASFQELDGKLPELSITLDGADATDEGVECQVCFETVPTSEADCLSCGHRYCVTCWKAFVSTKIHSGRDFYTASCMDPKCRVLVPTEFFRQYCDAADSARLDQLISNTFVDTCNGLAWCRRPACENVLELPRNTLEKARGFGYDIECSCGFRFCFCCGEDAHMPATCEQVQLWEEELSSASSAASMQQVPREKQDLALAKRWVLNHTRPCPACKAPIEKNKGCNHMICPGCKHEFCWLCLGSWEKHSSSTGGFFRCSMYDQDKDSASKLAQEFQSSDREEFIRIRSEARKERQKNAAQDKAFFIAQAKRRRVQYFQEKSECHLESAEWMRLVEDAVGEYTRVFTHAEDEAFFKNVGKLIGECHCALRWSYVVAYFLNDPILMKEWLVEPEQRYLVLFENIPGGTSPHYALFVLAQGNLEGLTESLTDALISPLMSPGLAVESRSHAQPSKGILDVSPVEYKNKLREISLKAKKQMERLGDLAKQLQQTIPRLAARNREAKGGGGTWACDECGYSNEEAKEECLMCASPFTLNYFSRCRKALARHVHCVRCNAFLPKPADYDQATAENLPCWEELECNECGHKAFELYNGKENVEQAEEEAKLFEGKIGTMTEP